MADTTLRVGRLLDSTPEVAGRGSRRLHLLLFALFAAGALLLLVRGWANRDVAAHLGVSEQQVANYRFAAVKKLTETIREAGLSGDVFPELQAEN